MFKSQLVHRNPNTRGARCYSLRPPHRATRTKGLLFGCRVFPTRRARLPVGLLTCRAQHLRTTPQPGAPAADQRSKARGREKELANQELRSSRGWQRVHQRHQHRTALWQRSCTCALSGRQVCPTSTAPVGLRAAPPSHRRTPMAWELLKSRPRPPPPGLKESASSGPSQSAC